jgi:hypothetical protein
MKTKLLNRVKSTLSEYEIDLTDIDLKKLINKLSPIFKDDILDNLPTIKEIDLEFNEIKKPSHVEHGIYYGSKDIITRIKRLY